MAQKGDSHNRVRPTPLWKRGFDLLLSGTGLVLSSPLWLLVAVAIKMEDGGPVFYTQDRVGMGGRIFQVYKFRSMVPDAEKQTGPVQATENDPRVTSVGKWLRATAMDELPQLWSIFKGDMSFVGPRALRPQEIEVDPSSRHTRIEEFPNYSIRVSVIPGLTGLAQVYAHRDVSRRNKFRYDALYVNRRSPMLDIELILLSFLITFTGKWEDRSRIALLRRVRRLFKRRGKKGVRA